MRFHLGELPPRLSTALADHWFDSASSKVFRGAMMAVTDSYDKEEVRNLWRAAEASGEVQLGDLEIVLDDEYDLTL